jgi:hypothetical protein
MLAAPGKAENILKLFEEAHGHPARNSRELEKWVISREGQKVLRTSPGHKRSNVR